MDLVTNAKMTSSTMKGTIRTPENGHPRMAPMPNQVMPEAVLNPPRQSMKADRPSILVYIVKLDGRYAVEAWNMPGLKTTAMRKKTAMRGFKVRAMVENSLVSQEAQRKASMQRRK